MSFNCKLALGRAIRVRANEELQMQLAMEIWTSGLARREPSSVALKDTLITV